MRSKPKRGTGVIVWFVDVDSLVSEKQRHHFGVAFLTRNLERSGFVVVRLVDIDSFVSQDQ